MKQTQKQSPKQPNYEVTKYIIDVLFKPKCSNQAFNAAQTVIHTAVKAKFQLSLTWRRMDVKIYGESKLVAQNLAKKISKLKAVKTVTINCLHTVIERSNITF